MGGRGGEDEEEEEEEKEERRGIGEKRRRTGEGGRGEEEMRKKKGGAGEERCKEEEQERRGRGGGSNLLSQWAQENQQCPLTAPQGAAAVLHLRLRTQQNRICRAAPTQVSSLRSSSNWVRWSRRRAKAPRKKPAAEPNCRIKGPIQQIPVLDEDYLDLLHQITDYRCQNPADPSTCQPSTTTTTRRLVTNTTPKRQ